MGFGFRVWEFSVSAVRGFLVLEKGVPASQQFLCCCSEGAYTDVWVECIPPKAIWH